MLGAAFSLNAQTVPSVQNGTEGWFLLINRWKLNDHWQVGNELHHRRKEFLDLNSQNIIRPWVDYIMTDEVVFSAGYSFVHTAVTEQFALNENNIWEQITLNHEMWKYLTMSHRFRLEHRWVRGKNNSDEHWGTPDYSSRFRYRLTAQVPISEKFYAHLFNELWINMSSVNATRLGTLDRNWIYVGVGYRIQENVAVELAYLDQWIPVQSFSAPQFELNRGPQLTVIWDL